jgi:hypothetical protein
MLEIKKFTCVAVMFGVLSATAIEFTAGGM